MMTQKIRVFGYLSCLLCAGSVLAQVPTSVSPGGNSSVSGSSGGTASVTPTGYTSSLLNSSIAGGSASIDSSVNASIRSSYIPATADDLKDHPEENLPVSSNAGDRRSPFSAAQFPIAGASQFGVQSGFHASSAAASTEEGMPKVTSKLSEARAWAGAGSKLGSGTDSSQMTGNRLSAKLQSSGFSSQQAYGAMGENQEAGSSSEQKLGGKNLSFASYTANGFPDSAKGTAMLSPPEVDYGQLFAKSSSSTLSFALPDLNNRQFLAPSLRVSVRRGSEGERSLEQRILNHLRNGDTSSAAEGSTLHKLASESDVDRLRHQMKSPLDRPLTNPLGPGSSRMHSSPQ